MNSANSRVIVRQVDCAWRRPVAYAVDHSVGLSFYVSDIANYFPSLDLDRHLFDVGRGGKGRHRFNCLINYFNHLIHRFIGRCRDDS